MTVHHLCDVAAAMTGPDRVGRELLGDRRRLRTLQLPRCEHVVLVAAHLDEGFCAAGGLVATLAEREARVTVLAVTEGDGRPAAAAPAHELGVRRARQSLALQRLGVHQARRATLALPSGEVAGAETDVVAAVSEIVGYAADPRRTVVIAPWRADLHPDHAAVGSAVAVACRAYGARLLEYLVAVWSGADPGCVPWDRARRFPLAPLLQARKRRALAATLGEQLSAADTEVFLVRPQ
jgi:LmbE family N-acetylglucosaminyl deacetylase